LYVRYADVPDEAARAKFKDLIRRRVEGAPVAYLVGGKEFFLLRFEVNRDVLIPRPATESLVVAALERLKSKPQPRILDLCTGSGAVATSVAVHLKSASLIATDISPAALEVARRNARRHGVDNRIDFRVGDLFAPLNAGETFDAIVANPPYVKSDEVAAIAAKITEHEPLIALDGGPEGFNVIDRIIAGAKAYLKPDGWLIFEIGAGQDAAAQMKLAVAGYRVEKPVVDGEGIVRVVVGQN